MAVLKWADPPANAMETGERRTRWTETVSQLKANPKQWAVVAERTETARARTLALNIESGKTKGFEPAGSFEAKYAMQADGTIWVYAQYVGGISPNGAAEIADPDDEPYDED